MTVTASPRSHSGRHLSNWSKKAWLSAREAIMKSGFGLEILDGVLLLVTEDWKGKFSAAREGSAELPGR